MNRGERQYRMYQLREAVQYFPTDTEITSQIDRHVLPYRRQMLRAPTMSRKDTVNQLGQIKAMLARINHRSPSRLMICVQAIDSSTQIPVEDIAFQHHKRNNIPDFVLWSDIAWGISMVRVPLYLGEDYIREYGKGAIERAIHEQGVYVGREFSHSETDEGYIMIQAEGREAARLLISDTSGFTLARSAVELVKQLQLPGRIQRIYPPNRIPAFVIAGAELCQLAYEAMYPLTETLVP